MKTILIAAALVAGISGYLINIPTFLPQQPEDVEVPVEWVNHQKLVILLFKNICEVSNDPTIIRWAEEFSLRSTEDDFLNSTVLSKLHELESNKGFLAKGEIFTEFNSDYLYELQIIYDLLYNAKNFDQFFKAAAWARQNLNCGLYLDAIYMAIQHRSDTERLSIPAPYELVPHYFIKNNVIFNGVYIAAGQNVNESKDIHVEGNTYVLDANYTAVPWENDDEMKLTYFREDIGLNSYYFLRKVDQASWLNTIINGQYGEDLYQMMKQLMARYNLERYSNGLPELSDFSWNGTFNDVYDPSLIYTNGNKFSHRTAPLDLSDNEDVTMLQTIENNIGTIVYHMKEAGYNKTQILNHLMEILVTSDRSYETLARRLLGKDHTDNGSPSVLEHYMTSLRDPVFWKLNYKIVNIIDGALKWLPPYTKHELYFPGVEIVNVDVKKMMTSFDYFEFDVTEALKINSNSTFEIKIGQPRLSHKPFTIKITISSVVAQKGLVKIFLGPKVLPGEFVTKKNLFVFLDQFNITLKTGSNAITRTSREMTQFSEDFVSLKILQKQIQDAEFGLNTLPYKTIQSQTGYPSRLILPKGSPQGLPLQLFVFIAPCTKPMVGEYYSIVSRDVNPAILSPGYPLDLSIQSSLLLEIPNAMLKDITVTHKGVSKVENYGVTGVGRKSYGDDNYDPASRPNYSPYKKEPFDYNSVKGQYGKSGNYLIKNNDYVISKPGDTINEHLSNENGNDDVLGPHTNVIPSTIDETLEKKKPIDYNLLNEQHGKSDNYLIKRSEYVISEPDDIINEHLNNVNDDYDIIRPHLKLASSAYDKTLKRKEPFNYKSTKGQYGKIKDDYSRNVSKSVDNTSLKNEYDSTSNQMKTTDNETNSSHASIEILQVQDEPEVKNFVIKPILQLSAPKRDKKRFTVYDYIFNGIYDDSSEEKVYEKK